MVGESDNGVFPSFFFKKKLINITRDEILISHSLSFFLMDEELV